MPIQKFKKLDLSYNKLESLPVALNKPSNLAQLNLEDNELKALSESLELLKNVNHLNFSLNLINKDLFIKSISVLN